MAVMESDAGNTTGYVIWILVGGVITALLVGIFVFSYMKEVGLI